MKGPLIVNAIRLAVQNCIKAGVPAEELWLGPREYGDLRAHISTHYTLRDDGTRADDEFYDGLLIRHMTESGYRVGATFSLNKQ